MRILSEIWNNSKEHIKLQLSTLLIMSLCFSSVFVLTLIAKNVETGLGNWSNELEMSVYLTDDIDDNEKSKVEEFLKQIDQIESFGFIDKEEAKTNFQAKISETLPSLLDDSIGNPFPASFELKIKAVNETSKVSGVLNNLKEQIMKISGVEDVGYGQYWIESYNTTIKGIRSSVTIVSLILSLASLLIIGNIIRAQVYEKKEEVEILELIGATSKWIRLPYLVSGGVLGVIAAIIGLGICGNLFYLAKNYFKSSLGLLGIYDQLHFFSIIDLLSIVFLCGLIGSIGSYLCVRSINNGFAASGGQS